MSLFDSVIVNEIGVITASFHAQAEELVDEPTSAEFVQSYIHIVDAVLITVIAWVVVVIHLEVNDFRHHLKAAYDDASSTEDNSRRYCASLMAIHYGMFDAIKDWSIVYTFAYAIIGGLTWDSVDTKFLTCIWGFSLMFCALILAVAGFKMPEWLGLYRTSQLKTIKDTSGFAAKAVENLFSEAYSMTTLRYQARLGVGKHFTQFFWLLLPFYTGLKFWWYLFSVVIGFAIGQLFIFLTLKLRQRFTRKRGLVGIAASAVIAIGSATAFTRGVEIVNSGWNRGIGKSHIILPACFFVWLAAIGLFHAWKYFEHHNFESDQDEPLLFPSTIHDDVSNTQETVAERDDSVEDALQEPLLEDPSDRRGFMKNISLYATGSGYFYRTTYFDRINLKHPNATILASGLGGGEENESEDITPKQVYQSFIDVEKSEAGIRWYHRIWLILPLSAVWCLFLHGTIDTFRCCAREGTVKSEFQDMSCGKKTWFIFRKIVKLLINIFCFFVAIIACGDAHQINVTRKKLPYVHNIYRSLNEGKVCAYDKKCGDIKTFESREAAHAANYSVAHCGICSGCSTWQDLSVQWTTREAAAKLAQSCGVRYLFDQAGMADCLSRDMGWTSVCSEAWVDSVVCARKQCKWIALRTLITNRLGNFQMQQADVTPATCNEAQCEQGNPGAFAKLSGASRRKMNIRSSIARSPDQQCKIVDDIPKDDDGYNDWSGFFDPLCPTSSYV